MAVACPELEARGTVPKASDRLMSEMDMDETPQLQDVRRSQLGRVAIDAAATMGYDAMTTADIADAAKIVRRTFSRYFPDKHAAFEYGYREATEALRTTVQTAYDAGTTPPARMRGCLQAAAEFLAGDPARAEALIVHGHAAGPGVAAVHSETMRRMTVLILRNAADLTPPDRDARVLAETVAGGIYEIVYARTARGDVRDLPALVPDWAAVAMAPYTTIAERDETPVAVVGSDRADR